MAFVSTQTAPRSNSVVSGFAPLWAAFCAKMATTFKNMQRAQLNRAMNRMSDKDLAHVGITRSEIADYADMVMRLHG